MRVDSPKQRVDELVVSTLGGDVDRQLTGVVLQAERVQTARLVHEELGDLLQPQTRGEVE